MSFAHLFYILVQHFLQYVASCSLSVLQLSHVLFLLYKFIILVESINIIIVIDDSIAINIGPKIIRKLAIIFHNILIGIIFQYHVVVIVTIAHQNVSGIELNAIAFHHFCSAK